MPLLNDDEFNQYKSKTGTIVDDEEEPKAPAPSTRELPPQSYNAAQPQSHNYAAQQPSYTAPPPTYSAAPVPVYHAAPVHTTAESSKHEETKISPGSEEYDPFEAFMADMKQQASEVLKC